MLLLLTVLTCVLVTLILYIILSTKIEEFSHAHSRPPRVIVTPAGRRRYMKLLYMHLASQRDAFDVWQIWLNTTDQEDLAYLRGLARENPVWILARELTVPHNGNLSINSFFPGASAPGTTYLRLDDDVVWLEPGFVETMMTYRETYRDPFLIYGSIVNNAIVSYLFQHTGTIGTSIGKVKYECMDEVGWNNGKFAKSIHETFLKAINSNQLEPWHMHNKWLLADYERVSINCILWLGDDFAEFGGVIGADDEEQWLSVEKPRELGRPNEIAGGPGTLCAHFAFYNQRPTLDATSILASYEELAYRLYK